MARDRDSRMAVCGHSDHSTSPIFAIGPIAVRFRVRAIRVNAHACFTTILAFLWAWMAVAYHFAFFATVNPAAWAFGGVFLSASLRLAWVGAVKGRLQFEWRGGICAWTGAALIVVALVIYPGLGSMLGHRYPAVPTFGLPCPTTIFTIGVLLFAKSPSLRSVFVVPILWSFVGAKAAFTIGVYQDLGLLVAGLAALAAVIRPLSLTPADGQKDRIA